MPMMSAPRLLRGVAAVARKAACRTPSWRATAMPCRQCAQQLSTVASSAASLQRSRTAASMVEPTAKSARTYATSTTAASSVEDPAEEQAQKLCDEGTTFLENGQIEQAKDAFKRSIEVQETSTAFFNLGVVYYHEQDLPNAISSWESSLRIAPSSADAHTNLASAYALSSPSRPDLAVEHLKTAARISPDDPEIQYNLAAVLEAVEQLEEALVAYKRALEGGIERASQNIRNVNAKILAAKLANSSGENAREKATDPAQNPQ